MRLLKLIPAETKFDFVKQRFLAFGFTILLFAIAVFSLATKGLNMGIDFRGGILIEATYQPSGTPAPVDVGALREKMQALHLGEVALQTFGEDHTVLLRVQEQTGGDTANAEAISSIKTTMGEGWTYNRAESVGPTVGKELLWNGFIATMLSIIGITVYVIFRFEWQFGISALFSTFHDVFVSLGLISFLGIEFNLTTVAALLLLSGYSINDTVIVFDRIRETMRRYKQLDMAGVVNLSVNATLSRTIMTSGLTMLAILPMLFLGGETLINFTGVITWGIVIGTFSSIYVAGSSLLYLPALRMTQKTSAGAATEAKA